MTALAIILVYANRFENRYQQNLLNAAIQMVEHYRWDWKYQTQYASGTTVWKNPRTDETAMIAGEPT